MPFIVGENVGSYRLMEKLGRGGMATVYKAYHAKLDRYVAIKALHPAFMEDPNFLARFQREARVVAKLEHPNIVPIYDFAEHEGRPYLVMKFIEGETLKACLNRGEMPPAQVVEIVEAVGQALTYAHERGVLHRDVKPSNVLLADDGSIYLADFGLARMAKAGESTLSADMMLGTPQYISPEQAMGAGDLDAGTDIYSFGVMLYELTVGHVPFSADTPFSIIHDHIYTPLPLPSQVKPDVPEPLERVLLKALAKEREDRHERVSDLVAAFKSAFVGAETLPIGDSSLDEPPVAAGVETPDLVASSSPTVAAESAHSTKKKTRQRWRWWQIALAALGVATLFILCVGSFVLIRKRIESNRNVAALSPTEPVATEQFALTDEINPDDPVAKARQKAAQNPDDPFAQLDLAQALYDDGQTEAATQAIETAYSLAEGNADVYLEIASGFHQREMWLQATKAYLEVTNQFPDVLAGEHMDAFHQSIYLAAEQPEAATLLPELVKFAPAMEQVAKARHLYYADGQDVQDIIDQALESIPDFPEARLLQVEIMVDQGRRASARLIALDLNRNKNTPEWIRNQLEAFSPGGFQASQVLEELRAQVEANPDDPNLRLRLIENLLDAEQWEQVEKEIQYLLETAGENPSIYYQLGEMLEKRNAWLYAAKVYQAGVKVSGQPPTPEMESKIDGLVYLGAAIPSALPVLEEMEMDLKPLVAEIAYIRHTLHNQDREVALEKITQLKPQYPNAPEVVLLEAEILYILGEEDEAIQQWNTLLSADRVPPWVSDQANTFLEKFQR